MMKTLARAYVWFTERAWYGRKLTPPLIRIVSTDGGRTWTDQNTGEPITREQAADVIVAAVSKDPEVLAELERLVRRIQPNDRSTGARATTPSDYLPKD